MHGSHRRPAGGSQIAIALPMEPAARAAMGGCLKKRSENDNPAFAQRIAAATLE